MFGIFSKNLRLLVVFVLFGGVAAWSQILAAEDSCRRKFSVSSTRGTGAFSDAENCVYINEILVTDVLTYPNELVLKNLSLNKLEFEGWVRSGKSVISLGEGMGGLVPLLLHYGVNVKGVDLWYHQTHLLPENLDGRLMREYNLKYSDYLVAADARALPFADESVDIVLSHKLFNNLMVYDPRGGIMAIGEVLRVLRPGGQANLYIAENPEKIRSMIEVWAPIFWFHKAGAEVVGPSIILRKFSKY